MHRTVIIRADGGKSIGMGHLARASLISDYLQKVFSINSVLLYKQNKESASFLKNKSIKTSLLPAELSLEEEIHLIKEEIHKTKCDLFVLDVLENDINTNFTQEIRNTKVPLAVITDDSFKRVINADVIINGNPCQDKEFYNNEVGSYFVGPKYFIMDEVYSSIKSQIPKVEIETILLTIGGSDHNNLIFKILNAIEKVGGKYKVLLITSEATGYIHQLKDYIETLNINVDLLIDINGIFEEWGKCDFAITAGGNTLFERIAARKPGLTICQLQRQMEIADKFEELEVNYNIGFGPQLSEDDIYIQIKDYLFNKSHHMVQYNKAIEHIDGKGLLRVSEIFKNLISNHE